MLIGRLDFSTFHYQYVTRIFYRKEFDGKKILTA